MTAVAAFGGGSSSVDIVPTDSDTTTDGDQVSLNASGDTEITVTVTAPNGDDTEIYTITVKVATNNRPSFDSTATTLQVPEDATAPSGVLARYRASDDGVGTLAYSVAGADRAAFGTSAGAPFSWDTDPASSPTERSHSGLAPGSTTRPAPNTR